jgi:uncharacterized integral membrane protein
MSAQPPTDAKRPADATPPGAPKHGGPESAAGTVPWGLIVVGATVVYAVLFVLFNDDRVEVSFVFFSTEASLVVALALAVALGFLLGFFVDILRTRRRKRHEAAKSAKT